MESPVIQLPPPSKTPLPIGGNYNLTLKQAIDDVLSETRKEVPDVSSFIEKFYLIMQSRPNPPLESIWVYPALTHRGQNPDKDDILAGVRAMKKLFGVLSACSAFCAGFKSLALLAPVMFLAHGLVVRLVGMDLSSKRGKKAKREVKSLVEAVLGHASVCCGEVNGDTNDGGIVTEFSDLVGLWVHESGSFEKFFPLLNGDIIGKVVLNGDCDVRYLAGAVVTEAFLLKICVSLRLEAVQKIESEKNELRNWVVASITGLRNAYFFEILVRMLLQDSLPVASLLGMEEQSWLKKILYDASLLVEYSFLCSDRLVGLPIEHVKSLSLTRLIVAYEAIECLSKQGDLNQAISYIKAFSNSTLPSQVIHWVSQTAIGEMAKKSLGSSPSALLKWLLKLEDRGFKVFNDIMLKHHAKSVFNASMTNKRPGLQIEGSDKMDSGMLFYIDNKGAEKDLNESTSAAFIAAAHTIEETGNGKRRRMSRSEYGKQFKFVKHEFKRSNSSKWEMSNEVSDDEEAKASEVDDPTSDEERSEYE